MAYTEFLTNLKKYEINVKVFLANKTMLSGKITDFDDQCIIIKNTEKESLVFKREMLSISPE